jgi:hypothetical protein
VRVSVRSRGCQIDPRGEKCPDFSATLNTKARERCHLRQTSTSICTKRRNKESSNAREEHPHHHDARKIPQNNPVAPYALILDSCVHHDQDRTFRVMPPFVALPPTRISRLGNALSARTPFIAPLRKRILIVTLARKSRVPGGVSCGAFRGRCGKLLACVA